VRPQAGLKYTVDLNKNRFASGTVFAGEDCLHLFNYGVIANYGWQYERFDLSFTLGCYHRIIGIEHGIDGTDEKGDFTIYWNDFKWMPLVGFNLDVYLIKTDRLEIKLDNMITIGMVVQSIEIKMMF
jgi:hypothetical protein